MSKSKPRKVLLVRPNMNGVQSRDALQPLAFAILAGLTPEGVELVVRDERIEPINTDEPADLVAMTVETFTAARAYRLAAGYRSRGIPVLMGGFHPTFLPDEVLEHADSVVIGEAENVWGQVMLDLIQGQRQRIYHSDAAVALDKTCYDRTIFQDKKYQNIIPVQFSRGCQFDCDFCSVRSFYHGQCRHRPVQAVIDEIKGLQQTHVFFVDDNIIACPQAARELFAELADLKIRWSCQVSMDVADDHALLKLMAQSGCTMVVVGFESMENDSLKQMNKGWLAKNGRYEQSLRRFQDHGLMIYGTFVIGYDSDSPDIFDRTVDFALRWNFALANFNPLTPLPGTRLYTRLQEQGRLIYPRWWLDSDYRYGQAIFRPVRMSPQDLEQGCFAARRKFNRYGSIIKRAFGSPANCRTPGRLGIHLAANLVSRREIYQKQGAVLGAGGGP